MAKLVTTKSIATRSKKLLVVFGISTNKKLLQFRLFGVKESPDMLTICTIRSSLVLWQVGLASASRVTLVVHNALVGGYLTSLTEQ